MSSNRSASHLEDNLNGDENISLPPSLNYADEFADWDREREVLMHLYNVNNAHISHYLEDNDQPKHGGASPGHITRDRGREEGHRKLWNNYFSENPTYGEDLFRRRFRMHRTLFLRIMNEVKAHDSFFEQKRDGLGKLGLSTLQKVTSAFHMLAYGSSADSIDEYLRIGETTAIRCLNKFFRAIVEIFGKEYLRSPNSEDIARLLAKGEERGFPGMLGSLDCLHWVWKNCPTGWVGQYTGRHGYPTIILEAVASYDLWIWHAYFEMAGSNNDINVLQASNLFSDLAKGITPPAHYTLQGTEYNIGYYLADSIYPKWSSLVQTISKPQDRKKQYFAMMQEAYRKDVERAFGVLQSRFAIIAGPARSWAKYVFHDIMSACIIMHNMIIEHERGVYENIVDPNSILVPTVEPAINETERFQNLPARHKEIKNKDAHNALRNALIEHLWERYSAST